MAVWLSLNWARCEDGVVLDAPPAHTRKKAIYFGDEQHFRWASDRKVDLQHQLSPARPLAVRFVNCTTDAALEDFLGETGLPHAYAHTGEAWPVGLVQGARSIPAKNVRDWQHVFRKQLQLLSAGATRELVDSINDNLLLAKSANLTAMVQLRGRDPSPRLNFTPANLFGFMQMEIATMAIGGTGLSSCEQCGEFFPTGSRTGRYARSKYCSARCRMAAHRKREKQGGN